MIYRFDPRLDLLLERVIDAPKELVWAARTRPEHVKKWFTPAPWTTVECEIDLRPGGIFRAVWTDALEPGFRPANKVIDPAHDCGCTVFTAVITLTEERKGTRYSALAMHEAMGFHDGWGATLDQLVALAKTVK